MEDNCCLAATNWPFPWEQGSSSKSPSELSSVINVTSRMPANDVALVTSQVLALLEDCSDSLTSLSEVTSLPLASLPALLLVVVFVTATELLRMRSLDEPIESFLTQRGVMVGVGGVTTIVMLGISMVSTIPVFFRLPRHVHTDFRLFPPTSFPP